MPSKLEFEEVIIKVPKHIMEFLRDHGEDPKEYLEYSLVAVFQADLETCEGVFINYKDALTRYNLANVFDVIGVPFWNPK